METEHKQSDHDLLIQINTKVERVISDVKEIRDNTTSRVDALESEKLDKVEAAKAIVAHEKIHDDFEKRLKWLERIAYSGLAIIAAVEFYFRFK